MFAIASPLAIDVSTWTSKAITPQPCRCALRHEPSEVKKRAGEPVELRDHERLRVADLIQRLHAQAEVPAQEAVPA
jgi:hypothetical protein